uniref:Uncharacterized protein n=1 Tax=Ditylenchus dipsaci TaxID=166011 RepID=A0A915CZL7_9BILA
MQLLFLQQIFEANGLLSSRRLANLPYIFAMMTLFTWSVCVLNIFNFFVAAPEIDCSLSRKSAVQAVSRNGLLYFVVANIFTALTNIFKLPTHVISGDLNETLF